MLSHQDYDAILCGLRMPDMGGPALFAWLERHRPHLCRRLVFVTGDVLDDSAGGFLARAGRPLVEKSFAPQEVRGAVLSLLGGSAAPVQELGYPEHGRTACPGREQGCARPPAGPCAAGRLKLNLITGRGSVSSMGQRGPQRHHAGTR